MYRFLFTDFIVSYSVISVVQNLSSPQTLMTKRKRHTLEEIIKKRREAATLLAEGQTVEKVCKKLEK